MVARERRSRFPIAVIGPGALGSLFAARLSKVVPVALIGREFRVLPEADWVIVLVKAYDTFAALRTARRMKPRGIVSLQNGLVESIPQGVTTAAAYREGRRVVPVTTGSTLLPAGFEALGGYLRSQRSFECAMVRCVSRHTRRLPRRARWRRCRC